jgi:LruC domain-containing protein
MKMTSKQTLVIGLFALAIPFTSCVDSGKDLFDAEEAAKLYAESFPVKNVDPDMDWKTTASANVTVKVNADAGVTYKIEIFDSNPLAVSSTAKLLTSGEASNNLVFSTKMDYPSALNTVYIARVDEKGRYAVQPATIENGVIDVTFGNTSTTKSTRATSDDIPEMNVPYTDTQLSTMLASATEIKNGWDLSAPAEWGYTEPVFAQPSSRTRYFKITKNFNGIFNTSQQNVPIKIIITAKVTINQFMSINSGEFIIADGGELVLNNQLTLTNGGYVTVLGGGKISGSTLYFSNASNGIPNYNGGTINLTNLDISCAGTFYNAGTMTLGKYNASSTDMQLVNRGNIKATEIFGNNNTDIKNACYIEVTNNLTARKFILGSNSAIKCGSFSADGSEGLTMIMNNNSMFECTGNISLKRNITGPTTGKALLKFDGSKIQDNIKYANSTISNNIICEVANQNPSGNLQTDKFNNYDWFVYGLKNGATICNPGKADFLLPAGDCTGAGYTPESTGDVITVDPIVYTYAFEDNFPKVGDYDFNDVVMDLSTEYTKSNNRIKSIQLNVTLKAIGATKQLGAGLRLVGVSKNAIKSITFGGDKDVYRNTLVATNSMFENATFESGDNNIVIPIFGDAHKVYGYSDRSMLNTGKVELSQLYTLKIIIELADQTQLTPLVTNDNLDMFIAYGNLAKRSEIHLYEFRSYGATAHGNVHSENLDVAGNLTWGVKVPEFSYPIEGVSIISAYPEFSKWAQNKLENMNWYRNPQSGKIFSKK